MSHSTEMLAFGREWHTEIVRVRCPFCLRTHPHGPGSLYHLRRFAQAFACSTLWPPLRRLPFRFPFEGTAHCHAYSWCIDKERQKYVTIGLPSEIKDDDYFIQVSDHGEDENRVSATTEASESSSFEADSADELASEFQSKTLLEGTDFADSTSKKR